MVLLFAAYVTVWDYFVNCLLGTKLVQIIHLFNDSNYCAI